MSIWDENHLMKGKATQKSFNTLDLCQWADSLWPLMEDFLSMLEKSHFLSHSIKEKQAWPPSVECCFHQIIPKLQVDEMNSFCTPKNLPK